MSASPPVWPTLRRVRPAPALLARGCVWVGARVRGQTSGSTTWRRPSCCRSIWIGGGPLRRGGRARRRRVRVVRGRGGADLAEVLPLLFLPRSGHLKGPPPFQILLQHDLGRQVDDP